MRKHLFLSGFALIFSLQMLAAAEPAPPEPGTLIKAGDVRSRYAFYPVVFYFTPEPTASIKDALQQLTKARFPGLPLVTDPKDTPKPPFFVLETELAPLEKFPVPDAPYFERHGFGITPAEAAAIKRTKQAVGLILVTPRETVWAQSRNFTELVLEVAEKTGAFIWDSSTRLCFSPTAWKERRLDTWTGTVPDVSAQITIHVYRREEAGGYLRAITLGMEKFGLPDLVVQELLAGEANPTGSLINATAQLLAENPVVETPASYSFSLIDLKSPTLREKHRGKLLKGATEKARLALVTGRWEEGDPDNPLVELDFRHGEGRSPAEKRPATFIQIWGSADSLVNIRHTGEIESASRRARAKLPELQRRFEKGLAPGERILLKAPFARDDEGNEWMWTQVMQWPATGRITVILQNEPFHIKKLRVGSRVLIKPEEVFDYIHYKADGTEEGNETGELIDKQAKQ